MWFCYVKLAHLDAVHSDYSYLCTLGNMMKRPANIFYIYSGRIELIGARADLDADRRRQTKQMQTAADRCR